MIVSEADLRARIAELGATITADYQGRPPLLVGVLKGAFMFMSDLSQAIRLPCEVDFNLCVPAVKQPPSCGGLARATMRPWLTEGDG